LQPFFVQKPPHTPTNAPPEAPSPKPRSLEASKPRSLPRTPPAAPPHHDREVAAPPLRPPQLRNGFEISIMIFYIYLNEYSVGAKDIYFIFVGKSLR
jgi:hypothetical protein